MSKDNQDQISFEYNVWTAFKETLDSHEEPNKEAEREVMESMATIWGVHVSEIEEVIIKMKSKDDKNWEDL